MKRVLAVLMIGAFSACQKAAPARTEAPACPVAKVNVTAVEAPLRNLVFARAENREIKERFDAEQAKQRERGMRMMKEYQSSTKNGKLEINLEKQMQNTNFEEYRLITETVSGLVRKELAGVVQTLFGDKYAVVIEQGYRDNVVHATCAIPDITNDVREYLVKESAAP